MPDNDLVVTVARIEQKLDDMAHLLLGNGQPGIIEKHDGRITKLERFRYWLVGALFAGGTAGGTLGHRVLDWINK